MTPQTQKRLQARHVAACARYQAGHQQQHTPEPFGHFKADPFGWSDCAETDDGAQPLYDQAAIDELGERLMVSDYALKDALQQRDALLAALKQVQVDISNGNCVMADTAVFVDAAIAAVEQPKEGSTA